MSGVLDVAQGVRDRTLAWNVPGLGTWKPPADSCPHRGRGGYGKAGGYPEASLGSAHCCRLVSVPGRPDGYQLGDTYRGRGYGTSWPASCSPCSTVFGWTGTPSPVTRPHGRW